MFTHTFYKHWPSNGSNIFENEPQEKNRVIKVNQQEYNGQTKILGQRRKLTQEETTLWWEIREERRTKINACHSPKTAVSVSDVKSGPVKVVL